MNASQAPHFRRSLDRRDFLRFRTVQSRRVLEISCQQLHMNYVNLQFTGALDTGDELSFDEPPTVHALRTVDDLCADLRRELDTADVACVVDRSWLVPRELRVAVETLLDEFTTRGGLVEFVS